MGVYMMKKVGDGAAEAEGDLYYSIFNNSHTPILVIDSKSGQIKDANLAACNYYGYTSAEIIKLNINHINILSDQEIHAQMEVAKQEHRKYFRFKHRLSNGEIREVEVYSGPAIGKERHLLISMIHDVQYKKEIEQRSRLQESYFKSLFQNSPEAIAILDNEFNIVNINDSFTKVFQYRIDDIRYKNVTEVLCDEKMYDESMYFKDSIKKGAFVRKDIQRKRKDGKLVHFSFLGYPILSNGEQVGVYSIYTDITKNKLYEEELKEARNKAEEASIFKTKFIANVAHEIRTPMNGIVGIIDLLDDNQLSPENKEYINMLRYSTERLSIIINDVIDIAKIEAGKIEKREERFHLKKRLEDVEKYFEIQAHKKSLDLKLNLDSGIPELLIGDFDKLNQVIFNLVSNAIKFTNSGFVVIDVRAGKRNDEDIEIQFMIQDTGIGIPKDQIDHIFDDFFQIDLASTKKCGGAGLGLGISQKLVHLMGGNISVESEFGEGSSFYFSIKFKIAEPNEYIVEPVPNNHVEDFFELNRNLRILLIEDEGINQRIIGSFLKKKNCIVTIASNGREALQILNKHTFDTILMDIYMPEMDGFELTKIIREEEKNHGTYTPIIAITAAVMKEDICKYDDLGIDDYIAKPFKKTQLYQSIATVLNKGNQEKSYDLDPLIDAIDEDYLLLREIINEVTGMDYQEELFGKIKKFTEDSNLENLAKYIHKLKGSLSHFQADSINTLLSELKEHCSKKDILTINQLLPKLKKEYLDLKKFLIKYERKIRD
jgi:PAS domain S-box-containing protein